MPRRPPRKWFYKILRRVQKRYPHRSLKDQMKIAAGIWWKMSAKAKRRLLKAEGVNPKNPDATKVTSKLRRKNFMKIALKALKSQKTPQHLKEGLKNWLKEQKVSL